MSRDTEITTVSPTAPATRSAAAERMRLHRQRRRDGLRCLVIELREMEIEALCRGGYLPAEQLSDRSAIIDALYRFLEAQLV
jgi:hypothetical protein